MLNVRKDFPILNRKVNGKDLIYFDNAATSQKPSVVIEALENYYRNTNANIHRGVHTLAMEATEAYELTRKKAADFIQSRREEVIFTRNTTESINLVAFSWGRENINAGDEILLTEMEHHSNLVPWQILAKEKGAVLKFIPVTRDGKLDLTELGNLVSLKTKLVGVVHVSNVLGTINPVKDLINTIKTENPNTKILVDGAQALPHFKVNVPNLGADFYAFSAHKMLGPTGVGVLWAKKELLEKMQPFLGGGEMNLEVHREGFVANILPWKFEAGTPSIADVVAFGSALDYLEKVGMKEISEHEKKLTAYALDKLGNVKDLTIIGPKNAEKQVGVISFTLSDIHSHDIASVLDSEGIAVRSGVQCAMPVHEALGIKTSTRASFYLYNTLEEIDKLVEALNKARKIFRLD